MAEAALEDCFVEIWNEAGNFNPQRSKPRVWLMSMVPFGVDNRIRIVVRDEKAESGRRGVLGKQTENEHRRRYEITSYHATALPIEVIDRVPVPKDAGIKVEVLDGATPPAEKDFDGKAGVYLWRLPGTPKKTETIRHLYSVRYPADRVLAQSDSGGDWTSRWVCRAATVRRRPGVASPASAAS